MRILLMLLVLVNFGFFAWQHWHAQEQQATPPVGGNDDGLGAGLALVGEQQPASAEPDPVPDQPVAVSEPSPQAQEQDVPARCATLGPFDALAAAEVVQARLAELGHSPVIRETGGQIRSGFWVYLPPFESRNAAKEIENELKARNVRDLFIVTASDQRNAISLGLYSTPERADQRAAEIGRLGYTPRVAERFRDATVYWVDFRELRERPLEPEAVGVMGAGETLPEMHEISCSDIAEAPSGA